MGISLFLDIYPGSIGSTPGNFLNNTTQFYFSANDSLHGSELWVSDGTINGTFLYCDIDSGSSSSSPSHIFTLNNKLYAVANEGGLYSFSLIVSEENIPLQNQALKIAPNPAKNRIQVQGSENETIRLYNTCGKLLQETKCTSIDVSKYENGLYILKAGERAEKLIIQK